MINSYFIYFVQGPRRFGTSKENLRRSEQRITHRTSRVLQQVTHT